MNRTFQFRVHLTTSGEILAQPVTFLPGAGAVVRSAGSEMLPEFTHLPVFRGVLTFNQGKNMMAQPLLKGGLQ